MYRFLLMMLCVTAWAEPWPEKLTQYKDRFLVSWEIELTPPQLVHIVRYFDFSSVPLINRDLEDYLSNPRSVDGLPKEVRREILPLMEQSRSGLVLPEELSEEIRNKTLGQWWKGLTSVRRRELVQNELLSDAVKVELFFRSPAKVRLAKSAPSGIRELFADLEWVIDRHTVEFRFKKPQTDLVKAERLRDRMGYITHTSEGFNDLSEVKKHGGASYHLHLSTQDGRDLTEFLHFFNLLQAVRLDEGGRQDVWRAGIGTNNGYSPDLFWKNILRAFGDSGQVNHFEVRTHVKEPVEELLELLELLSLPNEEAIGRVRAEIASKLNPKLFARMEDGGNHWAVLQATQLMEGDPGRTKASELNNRRLERAVKQMAISSTDRFPQVERNLPQKASSKKWTKLLAEETLSGHSPLGLLSRLAPLETQYEIAVGLNNVAWALNYIPRSQWPSLWDDVRVGELLSELAKHENLARASGTLLISFAFHRPALRPAVLALLDGVSRGVGENLRNELQGYFAVDTDFGLQLRGRSSWSSGCADPYAQLSSPGMSFRVLF